MATACFLLAAVKADVRPKIVGGQEAIPGQFPHQVSVQLVFSGHLCGGAVLDASTVITAAQCCSFDAADYYVIANEFDFDAADDEKVRNVLQVLPHPDFDAFTHFNDICLLKLSGLPLPLDGQRVAAVELQRQPVPEGSKATLSGWGSLSFNGDMARRLRYVKMPVVAADVCENAYGTGSVDSGMLCAGEDGKDACQGDAGGPLICGDPDERILCGIASWV